MKKYIFFLLFASFLLHSCDKKSTVDNSKQAVQVFNSAENAPKTFDKERLNRIDTVFQKFVDDGIIPHAVTMIVHKGNIVHKKAFGWRDIENRIPCQPDDYFRMASQTKAISSVALMTLFEEGKFLLDDPVKKYIPSFENPQVLVSYNQENDTYTTRPANKDITIRHLLAHTSGISYAGSGAFKKIFEKNGVPPLNTLEAKTLSEIIPILGTLPLVHDPGERFTYGMNTDVIGYLIEVLSGMKVDKYLEQRIFEPLGMNNTHFYLDENAKNKLVKLYSKNADKALEMYGGELYQSYPYSGAQTFFSTGAGLSGTIDDYAKFCQMILNGGTFNNHKILGRKTVELMSRNQVKDLRGDIGFGFAFDDFRAQYMHKTIASEGSLRWGGMFGTDYLIDPQEELILLFYINLYPNNSGIDFKVLFHNLVYQALN